MIDVLLIQLADVCRLDLGQAASTVWKVCNMFLCLVYLFSSVKTPRLIVLTISKGCLEGMQYVS